MLTIRHKTGPLAGTVKEIDARAEKVTFGRDPAVGSSVLITACTDSGGFFIFLGLATLFLM